MKKLFLTMLATAAVATSSHAAVYITEWMYNGLAAGSLGEYFEITNLGTSSVDLTGWSFDDSTEVAGSFSLSAFGTLAAGESAIVTDQTDTVFRTAWSLSGSVKIIGGNNQNLGRADEINIYDNSNTLVDRLTYDDQSTGTAKSIRTSGTSASILFANLGANNASLSVGSSVGDARGSYANTAGDIGNPGTYAVPEPSTYALLTLSLGAVVFTVRRKKLSLKF